MAVTLAALVCVVTCAATVALPSLAFAGSIEVGIDRPGDDLTNFSIGGGPGACARACVRSGSCAAWTYVRPGFQSASARCWLKAGVPTPVRDSCCVSGINY